MWRRFRAPLPSMTLVPSPRGLARVLAAAVLVTLAACSSTPKEDDPKVSAEKLYADAKDDMSSGAWDTAIKTLERVEGRAAGTLLAQQASLDLAFAYWKTNEKAQALSTLDRFIKVNPSSPGLDYALYLRGLVNFNDNLGLFGFLAGQSLSERDQQASRDAYQSFKQLTDQFPDSRYAEDARVRMDYIVNALAEYEVHVARYYYRRGAYLAAAKQSDGAATSIGRIGGFLDLTRSVWRTRAYGDFWSYALLAEARPLAEVRGQRGANDGGPRSRAGGARRHTSRSYYRYGNPQWRNMAAGDPRR